MLDQTEKKLLNRVLDTQAITDKIISFHKVALACGYKHIRTEQVAGIAESFCHRHPNYKAVRMLKCDNDCSSLFISLHFIDKSLDFEDDFIRRY